MPPCFPLEGVCRLKSSPPGTPTINIGPIERAGNPIAPIPVEVYENIYARPLSGIKSTLPGGRQIIKIRRYLRLVEAMVGQTDFSFLTGGIRG